GGKDEQYTGTALSLQNNTRMWACVYGKGRYGGSLQTVKPGNDDEYVTGGTRWIVASYKLVPTRALCFTGYERCENGKVCTFAERNGRGAMTVHVPAVDPATQNLGNSYGAETAPESVWNRTGRHLCFYLEPDYTGTWTEGTQAYGAYVVLRGDSITLPSSLARAFRSHELVNGTSECQ
ncbi:peptidase inhibitor family I36 protein, partial [Streptomyces massasporeus]